MPRLCEIAALVVVVCGLRLVRGQAGTVRQADYDVLRNTSEGPILCATDQPQLVRNDARSRLHCSTTCLQNDQCSSFNVKNGSGFSCEHFSGYPASFSVDPNCRHYAVSARRLFFKQFIGIFIYLNISGKERMQATYMPVKSSTMNIYMLDNETR